MVESCGHRTRDSPEDGERKDSATEVALSFLVSDPESRRWRDGATFENGVRLGRPISVEDAQIAAIARAHGLMPATRNVRNFELIEGLEVLSPWQ